jgi:hypothetical protein
METNQSVCVFMSIFLQIRLSVFVSSDFYFLFVCNFKMPKVKILIKSHLQTKTDTDINEH